MCFGVVGACLRVVSGVNAVCVGILVCFVSLCCMLCDLCVCCVCCT